MTDVTTPEHEALVAYVREHGPTDEGELLGLGHRKAAIGDLRKAKVLAYDSRGLVALYQAPAPVVDQTPPTPEPDRPRPAWFVSTTTGDVFRRTVIPGSILLGLERIEHEATIALLDARERAQAEGLATPDLNRNDADRAKPAPFEAHLHGSIVAVRERYAQPKGAWAP